jgi:hypothetical protein
MRPRFKVHLIPLQGEQLADSAPGLKRRLDDRAQFGARRFIEEHVLADIAERQPRLPATTRRDDVTDVDAAVHPPDERFLEEAGEPRRDGEPILHVLQLRSGASDTPRDASNGGWHRGSCLVD